jgi:hypothetical protein
MAMGDEEGGQMAGDGGVGGEWQTETLGTPSVGPRASRQWHSGEEPFQQHGAGPHRASPVRGSRRRSAANPPLANEWRTRPAPRPQAALPSRGDRPAQGNPIAVA